MQYTDYHITQWLCVVREQSETPQCLQYSRCVIDSDSTFIATHNSNKQIILCVADYEIIEEVCPCILDAVYAKSTWLNTASLLMTSNLVYVYF